MSHEQAAVLRCRASQLRTLATQMTTTPAMSLGSHAGVDTWFGPRPDACTTDLGRAQATVRTAADELRTQAFRFERHADELDAAAIAESVDPR